MSLATLRPFIVRLRNAQVELDAVERLLATVRVEHQAARQELDDAIALETI